jgi:hypothetical protein
VADGVAAGEAWSADARPREGLAMVCLTGTLPPVPCGASARGGEAAEGRGATRRSKWGGCDVAAFRGTMAVSPNACSEDSAVLRD